ncbi:MAG: DUF4349 domain-containing protein [Salibacteraceae bacterium]
MKRILFPILTFGIIAFWGCSAAPESEIVPLYATPNSESQLSAKVTTKEDLLSSSASQTDQDTSYLMTRTATLRFRVADVAQATYELERMVSQHGGRVSYTHLQSQNLGQHEIQVHPDSILEIHRFRVSNQVVIRIPDHQLDGLLRSIVPMVDFLDYRTLSAEDKQLEYLANQWAQKRAIEAKKSLENAPTVQGENQQEAQQFQRKLSALNQKADRAALANRVIERDAVLSTFTLQLYQRDASCETLLYAPAPPAVYQQSKLSEIGNRLQTGWEVLEAFLLFVVQSWSLILMAIVLWILVRRWKAIRGQKTWTKATKNQ